LQERFKSLWRVREVRLQQTLEFQKGLVIEGDMVQTISGETTLLQAVIDRMERKILVVLLPGKTLLLRCGDQLAVDDKRGGRIVVERGNPENGCHIDGPPRRWAQFARVESIQAWHARSNNLATTPENLGRP